MSLPLGRYVLERRLAAGGMGEVFLARQTGPGGFDRPCVVKTMHQQVAKDPELVELFLEEARLSALLTHPHVALVYDFGKVEDTYYIAMELVDGPALRDIVKGSWEKGVFPELALSLRMVSQAAQALDYVTKVKGPDGVALNLVHRDISPANLLLSNEGLVKVIDFGIARARTTERVTQVGVVRGKVAYMSPEQLLGLPLDGRADIFALGLVLYEMLTMRRGQQVKSLLELARLQQAPIEPVTTHRPDLPAPVVRLLDKALKRRREERFQTAAELSDACEEALGALHLVVTQSKMAALAQEFRPTDSNAPTGTAPTGTTPPSAAKPSALAAQVAQAAAAARGAASPGASGTPANSSRSAETKLATPALSVPAPSAPTAPVAHAAEPRTSSPSGLRAAGPTGTAVLPVALPTGGAKTPPGAKVGVAPTGSAPAAVQSPATPPRAADAPRVTGSPKPGAPGSTPLGPSAKPVAEPLRAATGTRPATAPAAEPLRAATGTKPATAPAAEPLRAATGTKPATAPAAESLRPPHGEKPAGPGSTPLTSPPSAPPRAAAGVGAAAKPAATATPGPAGHEEVAFPGSTMVADIPDLTLRPGGAADASASAATQVAAVPDFTAEARASAAATQVAQIPDLRAGSSDSAKTQVAAIPDLRRPTELRPLQIEELPASAAADVPPTPVTAPPSKPASAAADGPPAPAAAPPSKPAAVSSAGPPAPVTTLPSRPAAVAPPPRPPEVSRAPSPPAPPPPPEDARPAVPPIAAEPPGRLSTLPALPVAPPEPDFTEPRPPPAPVAPSPPSQARPAAPRSPRPERALPIPLGFEPYPSRSEEMASPVRPGQNGQTRDYSQNSAPGGVPAWAWALGAAVLMGLLGVGYFFSRGG